MATRNVRPMTVQSFMATTFMLEQKEKATQTFIAGAVLVNNGGYAQEGGADPADGTLLGISDGAGQNGAADGDKTSLFSAFLPGTIIEANLCAGASANTKALAQTDVGTAYGIIKRTVTGETHWVIDSSDTTNKRVKIIALRDDVGDINGRVLAIIAGVSALGGTV